MGWYTLLIENCGGFSGSHRQFGGVHARIVYTLLHNDCFPCSFSSGSPSLTILSLDPIGLAVSPDVGVEVFVPSAVVTGLVVLAPPPLDSMSVISSLRRTHRRTYPITTIVTKTDDAKYHKQ
jgi:hypothetical protein